MTDKKYDNGIIFGKFYPMHKGHVDFIKQALNYVKKLYVIVCSDDERDLELLKKSNLPKKITKYDRVKLAKEIFKNEKNIEVLHLEEDGIPSYPNGWKGWSNRVIELLEKNDIKIDIVFTNETQDINNYKENFTINEKVFNKNLEIKTTDIFRKNYNISATEIRENYNKNKEFLPENIKKFFEEEE